MANLPTVHDLQIRKQHAEQELRRIRVAHDEFLEQWDSIVQTKQHLLQELRSVIDVEKLSAVTQKISQLTNNP